jgi:hypothetical protein
VIAVRSADPRRHQGLDRTPDELFAPIAEQALDPAVDEHDRPVVVDDHHRVGRGVEQAEAKVLVRAQHVYDSRRTAVEA